MLDFSCHAWGFNNHSFVEAVATVARLGFRYIDLGTGPHIDLVQAAQKPVQAAESINRTLQDFNLQLADFYLMLPYINAPETERRERQLKLFESLIPFANALDTPGITVSPGILHTDGPEHSLARAVPALQQMLDVTEDDDLRVSFELHMDSAVTTPEQALILMEAVPGLSLTLDATHLVVQKLSWEKIKPLLEFTAHVHIRQASPKRLQSDFAEGTLDLHQIMRDLNAVNYHGFVTIEYMTTFGWHGTAEVNIPQQIVFTRDALREARTGSG
jgi:sugar phosphate isomerase/epimerase